MTASEEFMESMNWMNLDDYWKLRDKPITSRKKVLEPDFGRELGGYSSTIFYHLMVFSPKQ